MGLVLVTSLRPRGRFTHPLQMGSLMKDNYWKNWFRRIQSLGNHGSRQNRSESSRAGAQSTKPVVEGLEAAAWCRPFFDLTVVGAGQVTSNVSSVSVLGTTTFTPTASGAFLNANDILTALNSGNVTVNSGDAGTESGNIVISAALTGPNGLNNALTFASGTGVDLVGNITVNADLVAGAGGTLPLNIDATGTLSLNADLNSGPAAMALAAANGSIVQTSGAVENTTGLSLERQFGHRFQCDAAADAREQFGRRDFDWRHLHQQLE